MQILDEVYLKMIEYYRGDPHQIQHFVKVHSFASLLGREEGLDAKTQLTLEIAAMVHDIGIKPALQKYGSSAGPYQELVGMDAAWELLAPMNIAEDVIQRVCYLVSRHHTYTDVDGLDYRILLEADFLVNCHEGNFPKESAEAALEKVFRTQSGIRLHKIMFGLD